VLFRSGGGTLLYRRSKETRTLRERTGLRRGDLPNQGESQQSLHERTFNQHGESFPAEVHRRLPDLRLAMVHDHVFPLLRLADTQTARLILAAPRVPIENFISLSHTQCICIYLYFQQVTSLYAVNVF
jgi:hypothetical protein